jgi:3-dehydroquinate synthase
MSEPVTVTVGLGDRAYDIVIGQGLIERAGEEIATRLPGTRAAVVTDENVAAAHLDALQAGLGKGSVKAAVITLPPGEKTKSFSHLQDVVDGILAAKLERRDTVVAFGGGVVGDLAGFAAGITRRGMNFVQIPTSLLAQVDSSVGGKTGINSPRG